MWLGRGIGKKTNISIYKKMSASLNFDQFESERTEIWLLSIIFPLKWEFYISSFFSFPYSAELASHRYHFEKKTSHTKEKHQNYKSEIFETIFVLETDVN